MSRTIVLASSNAGKVREFNQLLGGLDIEVVPQSQFGVPDAEETGLTFVENAILKARNAAQHTGRPALADDSGLEVDALNGAPGIYSARYAGPASTRRAMPARARATPRISPSCSACWTVFPRRSAPHASSACWCTCVTRSTRRR